MVFHSDRPIVENRLGTNLKKMIPVDVESWMSFLDNRIQNHRHKTSLYKASIDSGIQNEMNRQFESDRSKKWAEKLGLFKNSMPVQRSDQTNPKDYFWLISLIASILGILLIAVIVVGNHGTSSSTHNSKRN